MSYNKHDWQDGELITRELLNRIEDGIGVMPVSGVSVSKYGAVGDGVTDDTQAFLDAINYASSSTDKIIYIPAGNYVITKHLDLPDNVVMRGASNYSTIMQPRGLDYLFSASNYNEISQLQINNRNNFADIKDINFSGAKTVMWGNFHDIIIMNGQAENYTYGIYLSPTGTSSDDLHSIYPNTFRNIYMYGVSYGLYIDNKSYGFVNSNVFDNIHIRRFSRTALTITSTATDGQGVSNNMFSNIELQAEPPVSAELSKHFVMTTGLHNRFININTWSDHHLLIPTLTFKLDSFQAGNYSLRDNYFSGKFETGIDTTADLAKINFLENIEINEWIGDHFDNSISILKGYMKSDNNNLLPEDLISHAVKNAKLGNPELMNVIPAGGQSINDVVFGVDDISPYIQIKDNGSIFIPMNGYIKSYVQSSQAFSVVFDFDMNDSVEPTATIYPSFAYYNSSNSGKKGFNRTFGQGAKIGVSTYRTTMYITPLTGQDLNGFNDYYASLTVNNVGTVKIRRVYIIGGIFSPNSKVNETTRLAEFNTVIKNTSPSATLSDLGIFMPNDGDTLLNFYQSFHTQMIDKTDLGNGTSLIKYPARF